MKPLHLLLLSVLLLGAAASWVILSRVGGKTQTASARTHTGAGQEGSPMESFYDLKTTTLEGDPVSLQEYSGKVTLVVNVASKCGLTPQYEGLEALYRQKQDEGFMLLGFPSSDFLNQEPGSPEEIRTFCTQNYGVTFPLFSKRHVKGTEKDEVYVFLTRELEEPTWNFTKYLVDAQGKVRYRFAPKTPPEDPELRAKIDALIAEARTTQP